MTDQVETEHLASDEPTKLWIVRRVAPNDHKGDVVGLQLASAGLWLSNRLNDEDHVRRHFVGGSSHYEMIKLAFPDGEEVVQSLHTHRYGINTRHIGKVYNFTTSELEDADELSTLRWMNYSEAGTFRKMVSHWGFDNVNDQNVATIHALRQLPDYGGVNDPRTGSDKLIPFYIGMVRQTIIAGADYRNWESLSTRVKVRNNTNITLHDFLNRAYLNYAAGGGDIYFCRNHFKMFQERQDGKIEVVDAEEVHMEPQHCGWYADQVMYRRLPINYESAISNYNDYF